MAPKQYLPQIKLRGEEGQLLTQDQEGSLLLEHVKRIFSGRCDGVPELMRMPEDLFCAHNWERALREIKPRKAVPRGEAQISAWQQHTSENARRLSELSIRFLCSDAPWIPTLWCKIQIAWLPKPKKTPCCPEHLRTVGLMSGDSKSFMTLLKNAAHGVVQRSLQSFPQFAYRSGASTLDAILRVTEHCHHVRSVLESINSSKTARLMGAELPSLRGGLMVAIDLTKAFDNVTYQEMYLGLCESGLDEALVRLIAQVHLNTSCSVLYGSYSGSVGMSKGLRQGCPIAPLVYLAWSARFLRQVNSRISDRWDLLHATVYADDKHLAWEIDGVHTFSRAIKELGVVLQVLRDLGMEVSFGKCEAVLSLKGARQAEILKKYTRVRNGSAHLVIKTDREILTPLKSEITYLGAVLSCGPFEYATAQHRCRQAWKNYKSLRRALRTNSVLSSAERLRIYRVCIWPVIEYGLCGTGVDFKVSDWLRAPLRSTCARFFGSTNMEFQIALSSSVPTLTLELCLSADWLVSTSVLRTQSPFRLWLDFVVGPHRSLSSTDGSSRRKALRSLQSALVLVFHVRFVGYTSTVRLELLFIYKRGTRRCIKGPRHRLTEPNIALMASPSVYFALQCWVIRRQWRSMLRRVAAL